MLKKGGGGSYKGLVDFYVQQGNAVECNISLQLLMHIILSKCHGLERQHQFAVPEAEPET